MPSRNSDTIPTAYPIGLCYCGCSTEKLKDPTAFFRLGHDAKAAHQVIREVYGNVANFQLAHGYGPGTSPPKGKPQ